MARVGHEDGEDAPPGEVPGLRALVDLGAPVNATEGMPLLGRVCRCGSRRFVLRTERPPDAVHGMADRGYMKPLSKDGPWAQCRGCERWYEVD